MEGEDKNIENFFKNRLDSNQFQYQEADWNLLEERLDAAGIGTQSGSSMVNTIRIIIGIIMITALGFLAGWLIRDQKEDARQRGNYTSQSIKMEESSNISGIDEREDGIILCEEEEEECYEESTLASIQAVQAKEVKKENLDDTLEANSNTGTNFNPTPSLDTNSNPSVISSSNIISPSNVDPTSISILEMANEEVDNSQQNSGENIAEEVSSQYIHTVDALKYYSDGVIVPVQLTLIEANAIPFQAQDTTTGFDEEILPIVIENQDGRFSAGLSLSPDFNGVGFANKMSASLRPGIIIYYKILPRISISTGASFDQKRYESTAENYSTPAGFWGNKTNGVIPTLINGSCRVIDIPLNLNVRFTDLPRVNYGGSAGVSSYILLDEAYDFEFEQDNPGADSGWSTKENSNYVAGLVNVSLYVSIPIGRNTEFLIEPYFKTPIKDIGWAKVALYGSGAHFVLKYNFRRNKNKPSNSQKK